MLAPTFVTFTPWTTIEGYMELLRLFEKLELVDYVAPIQLAIRLVIPANSRLLELAEAREVIGEYDEAALSYLWEHQDSRVERIYKDVFDVVKRASRGGASRRAVFHQIWKSVNNVAGTSHLTPPGRSYRLPKEPVPRMSKTWFC